MLDKKFFTELEKYIESHMNELNFAVLHEADYSITRSVRESELEVFIEENRKPALKQVLFNFIDQTGASDPEIYHRAGIDRKHFSKIRSNPNYRPGKNTIIALALALELDKSDTATLLNAAGYSLSESDTSDLVVQYCIEKKIYTIHDVNLALDHYGLSPLNR